MTCQELVELITAHLEGALDPSTESRLAAHLAQCEGCSPYLDQIRRTIRSLNDFGSR